MTTEILYVRNIEQQAAWLELDGQLSDGMWENARPMDHWKPWCKAEVRIAENESQLGRTFYARKTNYNFTDRELLEIVGKRMLGYVRIARNLGIEMARRAEFKIDTDGYLGRDDPQFTLAERQQLIAALADESYTMEDMRKDLRDLKNIIRRYVGI